MKHGFGLGLGPVDVGPSPHGEGGLKLLGYAEGVAAMAGPSPHGEGGLKPG